MKRGIILCLAVFGVLFAGCHSDDDMWGDWVKTAPIRGVARVGAVSFKIGDEVFVGLGYDKNTEPVNSFISTKDGGSWDTVPAFPGTGRMGAVAFVIGNKAYVGTGYKPSKVGDQVKEYFKDFYCYDNTVKTWTRVGDYPGKESWRGIAFSLNVDGKEIGYVGCGSTDKDKEFLNDFYSFDGQNWKSEGSHGRKRSGGTAFVIDNIAYICLGYEGSSTLAPDMMSFDGKSWKELTKIVDATDEGFDDDYTTIQRAFAVSFVAVTEGQLRGYIATGSNGSLLKNCWEYDPKSDRWDEVNPLPAYMGGRVGAVGFSIGEFGYVALGGTSQTWEVAQYDDTWKFYPGLDADDKNDY